ncbi:MAG: mercury transporter MerT [Deltaproteobacteria bacterium]|nr:MAG: mercury transporter MerT [Deltaproteobacteria bacterium]
MVEIVETDGIEIEEQAENQGKTSFLAAGGVIGAIVASSCFVIPLVLTLLGVSGAWMSNLRALSPYQPYFIAMTAVFIGFGFYRVYWKPRQVCDVGAACAQPLPNRLVKSGLWIGTVLVLTALTFPYWFASVEPYLP